MMELLETEKEWFIEAPWGKICVIAWGNCFDPPVLLCHGLIDSAVSFRPLVSLLPKNFYYIGMESPGHGKSDRYPPGLMISIYDYMYSIEVVVKHFRWQSFAYIGHSFGASLGTFYDVGYPGKMSKIVQLDPINFFAVPPEHYSKWYKTFFTAYYDNYKKYNIPKEQSPVRKREEVMELIKQKRGFTDELATAAMKRLTEPAGDGLVRYTYDLRAKLIASPPLSPEHVKKVYTSIKTPILAFTTEDSLKNKLFRNTQFLLDEAQYPAGNYRMRTVPGGHDVHATNPERVAPIISQFLLRGLEGVDSKAKL